MKNLDGGFIFVACFKRKIVAGGDFMRNCFAKFIKIMNVEIPFLILI